MRPERDLDLCRCAEEGRGLSASRSVLPAASPAPWQLGLSGSEGLPALLLCRFAMLLFHKKCVRTKYRGMQLLDSSP